MGMPTVNLEDPVLTDNANNANVKEEDEGLLLLVRTPDYDFNYNRLE